jgi:hypothetical protein
MVPGVCGRWKDANAMSHPGNVVHKDEEDGLFCISSDHCWRPGTYESREAAEFAFEFCDDLLSELRDAAVATNGGGDHQGSHG